MFDFDEVIDRHGTSCAKWDDMGPGFGVSAEDGLAMWVADMDFRAPQVVNDALHRLADHGVHGYFGDEKPYKDAIIGWMERRHGWTVASEQIATVHGIVAGLAICLRAYLQPGDGVILFTPVYHAFAKILKANGMRIHESPLRLDADGRFQLDLEALAASLKGDEKMLVFCSPHNPGGRIWTPEELRAVAEFCAERDLLLVSDEIHHDIVMPGARHMPMPLAAPEHLGRLIMLTAATKVFNIAGGLTGNVIIPDKALRERFDVAHRATGTSVNRLGAVMVTAAYSGGDAWCDALCAYLAENARVFKQGVDAIPGVSMMPLEATYLAWVDFRGTGMEPPELTARIRKDARIAANDGPVFGTGGAGFMRFNLGTQRSRVEEAVGRLQAAFGDLQ
ncbi:MalY/PatB family protein [Rhodobacteraceae bacterium DSL-40]|uniref:MalY/PatB family protein n=1 Tax=Amaricoccus sp. B4 TaxID=3368557 RepID=UPI000DAEB102